MGRLQSEFWAVCVGVYMTHSGGKFYLYRHLWETRRNTLLARIHSIYRSMAVQHKTIAAAAGLFMLRVAFKSL